jgi:hypothetical protein
MRRTLLFMLVILAMNASAFAPREARTAPKYVGSAACAACHGSISKEFTKTSMGRSFSAVTPHLTTLLPEKAVVESNSPGHKYHVYRDKGRLYQGETFRDKNGAQINGANFPAEYVVGSGASGYTFLFRRGDRLFEAPLSYYSSTRNWDLSPGFDAYDAGFTRPVRVACLECHIGRFAPAGANYTGLDMPRISEQAIGCEKCHGSGELHVRERAAGKLSTSPDETIVNPGKLSRTLATEICLACHQGNDVRVLRPDKALSDFRPGNPLSSTLYLFKVPLRRERKPEESDLLEHGFAMVLSKCYQRSKSMTCTTCHSVHRVVEVSEEPAYYRSKCLTCHAVASCTLDISKRQPDNCISCHMPKRPVTRVAHTALTNHRIARQPDEGYPDTAYIESPDTPGLISVEEAAGGDSGQVSQLALLEAYRAVLHDAPWLREKYLGLLNRLGAETPDEPRVLAARGHDLLSTGADAEVKQAIPLLDKAFELRQTDSDICLDLADALSKQQRAEEADRVLEHGLARDPYEPRLHKALIALKLKAEEYAESESAMREYLQVFPADTGVRRLLTEIQNMSRH